MATLTTATQINVEIFHLVSEDGIRVHSLSIVSLLP